MKVYISPGMDVTKFFGKFSPALNYLNIQITNDILDDYDDAISDLKQSLAIRKNFKSRGMSTIKYEILDKFLLSEILKNNGFNFIETIIPKSIDDIAYFIEKYGSIILKPRLGGGERGLYGFHYNTYSNISDVISDVSTIQDFWEVQNNDEEFNEYVMLGRQTVIQPYISNSNNTTTINRVMGEIGVTSENLIYTIGSVRERFANNVDNTHLDNHNQIYLNQSKIDEDVHGSSKTKIKHDDMFYDFLKTFFDKTGINTTFFQFEFIIEKKELYLIDTSLVPQRGLLVFEDIDKTPYIMDRLRYIYGLSDTLEYNFSDLFVWKTVIISTGIQKEYLDIIENDNVKRAFKSQQGDIRTIFIIRGNTDQEIEKELKRIDEYVKTL